MGFQREFPVFQEVVSLAKGEVVRIDVFDLTDQGERSLNVIDWWIMECGRFWWKIWSFSVSVTVEWSRKLIIRPNQ